MTNVVIIDNHDSFTWNLHQLFAENGKCIVTVIQNQDVILNALKKYDKIVFSPGPDVPKKYPQMAEILQEYQHNKSILGVCLGHQAIIEYYGGKLKNLSSVFHGSKQKIKVKNSEILFKGLESNIEVGLYHSWAADEFYLPECLTITARNSDDIIMGISHKNLDVKGIQFHPESYMTIFGYKIIDNWIKC